MTSYPAFSGANAASQNRKGSGPRSLHIRLFRTIKLDHGIDLLGAATSKLAKDPGELPDPEPLLAVSGVGAKGTRGRRSARDRAAVQRRTTRRIARVDRALPGRAADPDVDGFNLPARSRRRGP